MVGYGGAVGGVTTVAIVYLYQRVYFGGGVVVEEIKPMGAGLELVEVDVVGSEEWFSPEPAVRKSKTADSDVGTVSKAKGVEREWGDNEEYIEGDGSR